MMSRIQMTLPHPSKKKKGKQEKQRAKQQQKANASKHLPVAQKAADNAKLQHEKEQAKAQAAATKQIKEDATGALDLVLKVVGKLQPIMHEFNLLMMSGGTTNPKIDQLPDAVKTVTISAHDRGTQLLAVCQTRMANSLAPINFTLKEATKVCGDAKLATSMLVPFGNVLGTVLVM